MAPDQPPITRDALTSRTLELVGYETSNPPGDTREIVRSLEDTVSAFGLETERFVRDPSKPNLLARVPGVSEQTLLYSGHLDTVPYDPEGWSYDPLGERVGDRVYGRGTTDMKGAIAAMVELARYYATDEKPPLTLAFAFVSDEEVGGPAGVKALLEADKLEADACVIGEPTCTSDAHSLTVADRGSIWLTLEATGEAAHGSRPMFGTNAIDRLWTAITDIRSGLEGVTLSIPAEVEPILEASLEYYAPSMGREVASDLFHHPTVNLGTIQGGDAVNSVPRFARAELDVRLSAGVDTEAVLERVRSWVADIEGVTIADVSWSVGSYERPDSPLVSAVTDAAEAVLQTRVYERSATGGGDAKRLRRAGIPTVEFAVATDTAHACDEYITIDALARTAAVYQSLPALLAERWESYS